MSVIGLAPGTLEGLFDGVPAFFLYPLEVRILTEVSVKGELDYHWQGPFVITTAIRKSLLRLRKLTETRW